MNLMDVKTLGRAKPHWMSVTVLAVGCVWSASASADAVGALDAFVQGVKSGRVAFTQTVTSPDGGRKKVSTGTFEFQRPSRFRFDYAKPVEQQIVADGAKVWMYDPDLNQVTVRPYDQALGNTPAAVLSGGRLARDFELKNEPDEGGLQWVSAVPRKRTEGGFRTLRIGFKGQELAAFDIVDGFGQRSRLDFSRIESNVALAASRFQFTPPAGADVLKP